MTGNQTIHGVGVGLRLKYIDEFLETPPLDHVDFFEIAPENYMKHKGKAHHAFCQLREQFPFLVHGLSLSLGSTSELNWDYLKDLKKFLHRHQFPWFTDHLCVSSVNGHEFHDLLPLPLTEEALVHVSERARIVQDFLEMPLALENASFYMHPEVPEMSEVEFIKEVLSRSQTSLMLDINNVYVNSYNFGYDAKEALTQLSDENILHMHMAGHENLGEFIVDTHGAPIIDEVWDLLRHLGNLIPLPPIIIERDLNPPPSCELFKEVKMAQDIVTQSHCKKDPVHDARQHA